jgi:hypothetical protein
MGKGYTDSFDALDSFLNADADIKAKELKLAEREDTVFSKSNWIDNATETLLDFKNTMACKACKGRLKPVPYEDSTGRDTFTWKCENSSCGSTHIYGAVRYYVSNSSARHRIDSRIGSSKLYEDEMSRILSEEE